MTLGNPITQTVSLEANMVKKSDKVRSLVSSQNYRAALCIAKDFRLGIAREQSDKMARAYECMVHERFYRSLGVDIPQSINEGVEVLVGLYGKGGGYAVHQ